MASSPYNPSTSLIFFLLFLLFSSTMTSGEKFKLAKEKKTHLHFYFHDIVSGPHPTAVGVAPAGVKTPVFGSMVVFDDPLTEGPNVTSKSVGQAQGVYVLATQSRTDPALFMAFNFVFTAGEFNGSTLAVLGRNEVFAAARELPVIGGTGAFRLARGYATIKTYFFNSTSGDATTEYNVYVLHH